MTTALNEALDDVARIWSTLTPTSRPESTYHRLDESTSETRAEDREDDYADRGFYFEQASPATTIQETGSDHALVETVILARLLVSTERVGHGAVRAALADELTALTRAVDTQTSWPTGVHEVYAEDHQPEGLDEAQNLASGSITLVLTTEET